MLCRFHFRYLLTFILLIASPADGFAVDSDFTTPWETLQLKIVGNCVEPGDGGDVPQLAAITVHRYWAEIVNPSSRVASAIAELEEKRWLPAEHYHSATIERLPLAIGAMGDGAESDLPVLEQVIWYILNTYVIYSGRDIGSGYIVTGSSDQDTRFGPVHLSEYYCKPGTNRVMEFGLLELEIPTSAIDISYFLFNDGKEYIREQIRKLKSVLPVGSSTLETRSHTTDCGYLRVANCTTPVRPKAFLQGKPVTWFPLERLFSGQVGRKFKTKKESCHALVEVPT